MEPVTRRVSWKKEIRRGPRPGDESPYSQDTGVRDRVIATMFGTQVSFGAAFAVLILVAAVFYAQYSGAVRWLFAIVLVAAGAYILVMFVGARVRDPRPLQGSPRAERRATGELRALSTTLDRASAGLKYSQVMFAGRMMEAFLEKVRVSRGLSREELDRVRSDPEGLMALLDDRELAIFVLESARNHRQWPALLPHLPTRRSFLVEAGRVLAKMEAWR